MPHSWTWSYRRSSSSDATYPSGSTSSSRSPRPSRSRRVPRSAAEAPADATVPECHFACHRAPSSPTACPWLPPATELPPIATDCNRLQLSFCDVSFGRRARGRRSRSSFGPTRSRAPTSEAASPSMCSPAPSTAHSTTPLTFHSPSRSPLPQPLPRPTTHAVPSTGVQVLACVPFYAIICWPEGHCVARGVDRLVSSADAAVGLPSYNALVRPSRPPPRHPIIGGPLTFPLASPPAWPLMTFF